MGRSQPIIRRMQIITVLSEPLRDICLQIDHADIRAHRVLIQQRANDNRHRTVRQQSTGGSVMQHVVEPFSRIVRVKRYVGSSGFQYRQQCNHHFYAALHTHAYQCIRANVQIFSEESGQLVRFLVQLHITQHLVFEHHRNGVRRPMRLLLN